MTTTKKTTPVAQASEEAAGDVARLRETLALKAHLAGMDAKTLWEDVLWPQLEAVRERLQRAAERARERAVESMDPQARLQLHLALMESRDRWQAIEPRLLDLLDRIARAGGQAAEQTAEAVRSLVTERAKLEAHLARLDAEAALARRREEAERELERAQGPVGDLARRLVYGVARGVDRLQKRLAELTSDED